MNNEVIDFAEPLYFISNELFDSKVYKLQTILFLDDDVCLCVARPMIASNMTDDEIKNLRDEKIYFNLNGFMLSRGHERFKLTQDFNQVESYVDYYYG